ncbi:Protein PIR-1 a [Aphelenchoides avenae]|nr:Protein PIR-1 a [Aphelenchus avenae]
MSTNRPKKFPSTWLRYTPVGNVVENTRFIPFKTPLDEAYFEAFPENASSSFTVDNAVQMVEAKGFELGLVIDLTCTSRYYDSAEWRKHGVDYVKLKCGASNIAEQAQEFCNVAKNFMEREPTKLIGVHCAHGLNRTGYIICAYLITTQNCSPVEAIARFERARGHPIETSKDLIKKIKPAVHKK